MSRKRLTLGCLRKVQPRITDWKRRVYQRICKVSSQLDGTTPVKEETNLEGSDDEAGPLHEGDVDADAAHPHVEVHQVQQRPEPCIITTVTELLVGSCR